MKSKLLDEKVVESAKEMLKKLQNNAYATKKLNAVWQKAQYNSCSKNMLHFKNSTNCMDKASKI
ncbi:hypothetical protein GO684_01495 [Wolbachia endosymbiont of Litomosoides brasiliensis]|uniref:hypothetical protein n=1 Tax=Wolbachia endosymbiont of Litomosoides brasiliensis TaxID=1812117 RepID=UPI0015889464|nr:hypothetical protein [Wolbachia endosymbiont of Litomosoides brasiliensis]NUY39377.1 hypothetical protein [Wolbachia endosymbiont of Litomosoides brasiliensis]